MHFIPNYEFRVINDENFNTEILNVEKILNEHKNTGEFVSFDNTKIYYEYFLAQNAKANVVIVHGLSEFTKKFYELSFYLLNQGYNVFLYDQRCHGLSGRLTKDKYLLHVDSFNDYATDLEQFIDNIVQPTQNLPIYLYSHSMGGAVSALYMAKHQDKIQKAVLAAPLFDPVVKSVPEYVARLSVRMCKVILGPKKRFFQSKDFDPFIEYKEHYGSSKVRFDYNITLRKNNENYQTSPMSFSWVLGSLTIKNTVLKDEFINKIKTPILLISAEKDNTVKTEPHKIFASKCKQCKFVEIKNETHALLAARDSELENMIKLTLEFYSN